MSRILIGSAVTLLLTTGAFLFWQGHAADRGAIPAAPPPNSAASNPTKFAMLSTELPAVPEATSKTREEKRFSRVDKDKDGRITAEELFAPGRKAFAKLDRDGNGTLTFDEWAVKTITKFRGADEDHDGALTGAEYAETAAKARKRPVHCAS